MFSEKVEEFLLELLTEWVRPLGTPEFKKGRNRWELFWAEYVVLMGFFIQTTLILPPLILSSGLIRSLELVARIYRSTWRPKRWWKLKA